MFLLYSGIQVPIRALKRWAPKEYTEEWFQDKFDWYCSPAWELFEHISSTSKLGDQHLKTVAFAMCAKKYGKGWMLKARVFHISIDTKDERARPYDFVRLHEQIRRMFPKVRPEIAICFLETETHIMLLIHDNKNLCMALDDLTENFHFKHLANLANRWLCEELDFTRLPIVWPTLWKQMDIYSCGFHVLHYLDHFMFKGEDVTYEAPTPKNGNMDWKVFAKHLDNLVRETFTTRIPYVVEEVHPPVSFQS